MKFQKLSKSKISLNYIKKIYRLSDVNHAFFPYPSMSWLTLSANEEKAIILKMLYPKSLINIQENENWLTRRKMK